MANKGGCGKRWPQIRAELEKHLGPIDDDDIAITRARNHATKLAQEAVDAGCRRLISVGGDAATISWRAQRVPLLKRLGPISYVLMTAFTSLTYSPRAYRIRIDDEAEQNLPMWSLMLCSFDGAGEGLMLAPGADPGDRKLDLIMVGEMGRWESLTKIVPNLGDGSYLAHPKVSRRHATRITIDSDLMVRADVDGESIGQLPMSVTVLPFHLKVAAVNRT